MVEQKTKTDGLLNIFLKKRYVFAIDNPSENTRLNMLLAALSASYPAGKTDWETIKNQIDLRVEESKRFGPGPSAEGFIEHLFSPDTEGKVSADLVMRRLLIG